MTTVYLVRHAKVKIALDDRHRPLSDRGRSDVPRVTAFFKDLHLDHVVSSPYVRAVDTVKGIASDKKLDLELIEDLRERKIANEFINDFGIFTYSQWSDFDFKLPEGESLNEVQTRGTEAFRDLLDRYDGKTFAMGTHGTFMSVLLNAYDKKYDYEFWKKIKSPDIFKVVFEGQDLVSVDNLIF